MCGPARSAHFDGQNAQPPRLPVLAIGERGRVAHQLLQKDPRLLHPPQGGPRPMPKEQDVLKPSLQHAPHPTPAYGPGMSRAWRA
eukprot:9495221-Pyramimonas_sp.AAC.2